MSFRSLQVDREHSIEHIYLNRQLSRQRSNSTPTLCTSGDVNAKDSKGRTLLFYAAKYGQTEIARQLLDAGCDPNIADCNKNTALHEATDGSHLEVVKLLIKNGMYFFLIINKTHTILNIKVLLKKIRIF